MIYAPNFGLLWYSILINDVSRVANDDLMKNVAEILAAVSSGFKDLSSQIAMSQTTLAPPVAADPSDNPGKSKLSKIFRLYTSRPLPQLDRTNYMHVKMWDSDGYNGLRKGGNRGGENAPKVGTGSSTLSSYMEDKDGNDIPETERVDLHETAWSFWEELLEINRAPSSWGSASRDIKNEFVHILESEYFWIRLCKNHWKAEMVATNHYSQWYKVAYPRKVAEDAKKLADKLAAEKAALEAVGLHINDNSRRDVLKRPRVEEDEEDDVPGPSKRLHVEESRSSPPRSKLTRRTQGKQVHRTFSPVFIKCLYTRQKMLYGISNYMRHRTY